MKFIEFNLNTGELARFALKAFDSGNVCVPCLCATVCVCVSHEYSLDLKDTDSIQESSALTSHGYQADERFVQEDRRRGLGSSETLKL